MSVISLIPQASRIRVRALEEPLSFLSLDTWVLYIHDTQCQSYDCVFTPLAPSLPVARCAKLVWSMIVCHPED